MDYHDPSTSLQLWSSSPVSGQPCDSKKRDIAAEAFSEAVRYVEQEFQGNTQALTWLKTATSTSLEELLETTHQAEARVMHYGKVLDTLSQHHPEYVSLVWGLAKFVLMGIINHGNLVAQFSQALSLIASVLPVSKLNAELYKTDQMKDAVASLYGHILLFLQQAVKWYNIGPAGRALTSLFKPFELSYRETVKQIELCAQTIDYIASVAVKAEIREISVFLQGESRRLAEREEKLHEMQRNFSVVQAELSATVGTILQIVSCDTVKIEELQLSVRDIRPRVVDLHFNQILEVLKPRRSPEEALQKQRSLIRRAAPWRSRNNNTKELLQNIGHWISESKSSLLVLQVQPGGTARVKEIASELISLLQPQSKQVIWYLSSISLEDGSSCTKEVLRSLVFQSVKLTPDLVSMDPGHFSMAKLHAPHSEDEWLELLCNILRRLTNCFIIVDAEDVFRDAEESTRLIELFQRLANQFTDMKTAAKLLMISYGGTWQAPRNVVRCQMRLINIWREPPVPPRMRRPGARSVYRSSSWKSMGRIR